MKKLFALTLALLMLALPALAETSPTLTVTGSASVSLKADYARVTVGVRTTAKTVTEATDENGAAIRQVVAALKEAGVAEQDIATSNYSVNTEYDYSSVGQQLIGYSISNQLTVIIRDMDNIGATLDKATAAGANSIYNIEFLSTAASQAQDEATVYAVKDALRKASLLAGAADLTVGNILSITESTSGWYTTARTYDSVANAKLTSNFILPDETTISASVSIVFELVNPAAAVVKTPAVTGDYEPFSMDADREYYDHVIADFPSDVVLGSVCDAQQVLNKAKELWNATFPTCDCSTHTCEVRYDSDAGVWHVRGTLAQALGQIVFGGCANTLIRAEDGQVLALWHER